MFVCLLVFFGCIYSLDVFIKPGTCLHVNHSDKIFTGLHVWVYESIGPFWPLRDFLGCGLCLFVTPAFFKKIDLHYKCPNSLRTLGLSFFFPQTSSTISDNHWKWQRSGQLGPSEAATICIGWLTSRLSRVFFPEAVDPETCKLSAHICHP